MRGMKLAKSFFSGKSEGTPLGSAINAILPGKKTTSWCPPSFKLVYKP